MFEGFWIVILFSRAPCNNYNIPQNQIPIVDTPASGIREGSFRVPQRLYMVGCFGVRGFRVLEASGRV